MIKKLSKFIGEYKLPTILTPVLIALEVVMEVLIPLIMADLIDKGVYAGEMSEIYKLDIATYRVIANANAYTRGEFFLIDSSNPTIKEFLKISTRSRAIKQALYNVTGKKYKLGLFKRSADEVQKQDLLEALINSAENNVKINFE